MAVLVVWQVLIWCRCVRPSTGIHQWEDNVIRVQRYADAPAMPPPVVLVGSSLMARLDASSMGSRVLNVALSGGSPHTGIEMVRRRPVANAIVVEMSGLVSRKQDEDLIDGQMGGLAGLRRHFSVLRREYQPVSTMVSAWRAHILDRRSRSRKIQKPGTKTAESRAKGVRSALAQYQPPLTEQQARDVRQGAETMRQELMELKRLSAIRIVLDHLPLDPAVEATATAKQTLAILRDVFSGPDWQWVPDAQGTWETNDGLHLTEESAHGYAQFLREWLIGQGMTLDK